MLSNDNVTDHILCCHAFNINEAQIDAIPFKGLCVGTTECRTMSSYVIIVVKEIIYVTINQIF